MRNGKKNHDIKSPSHDFCGGHLPQGASDSIKVAESSPFNKGHLLQTLSFHSWFLSFFPFSLVFQATRQTLRSTETGSPSPTTSQCPHGTTRYPPPTFLFFFFRSNQPFSFFFRPPLNGRWITRPSSRGLNTCYHCLHLCSILPCCKFPNWDMTARPRRISST